MQQTLILVKPDAFARGLTGEIIARFERKGLKIVALKHMTISPRRTTTSTRTSRSSASSSTSSPAPRSWRWCSKATRQ
jgi:nucleoside diphosphate kinase